MRAYFIAFTQDPVQTCFKEKPPKDAKVPLNIPGKCEAVVNSHILVELV